MPAWVTYINPLYYLYFNPVFQRRMIRNILGTRISQKAAFIAGFVSSFPSLALDVNWVMMVPLLVTGVPAYFGLVLIVLLAAMIRVQGVAVASTIRCIRELALQDRRDPVLTTPLSDSAVFFGVTIGNPMRGHVLFETAASFVLGLSVMYVLLGASALIITVITSPAGALWLLLEIALTLLLLCYMVALAATILLLLTFSSALYAAFLDALSAVIMAIVHFLLVIAVGCWFVFEPLIRSINMQMSEIDALIRLGLAALLLLGWLILATYGTGWAALILFSRSRRPGVYVGR